MWMYDTFYLDCKKCWNQIEKQTKVWKCLLWSYSNNRFCPKEILLDMHWKSFNCDKCWTGIIFDMDLWMTNQERYRIAWLSETINI